MKRDFQRLTTPHFFAATLIAMGLLLAGGLPGRAITITPIFDSSITTDPNAATIEATINAAIGIYESVITDPISVTIEYKEMTSGLGTNSTYFDPVPYTSYVAALANSATSINDGIAVSHLPHTLNNPVNNNLTVNLQLPNARALGFAIVPPDGMPDGTVSLNTSIMNLSRASTDPSKFDLMATAMHETDEVLGFGSALNGLANGTAPPNSAIWPMDLFRYDASGARSFNTAASATAFFSLDGTTDLVGFNQHGGGDYSDFLSWPHGGSPPRIQDAYATPGATPNMGIEFTALDIMGYHLVPLSGDANSDGIVNSQDLALIASSWLAKGSGPADLNHDGIVNSQDLALISANWLGTYGSAGSGGPANAAAVPEPATWLLAAIAVVMTTIATTARKRV
ncbi:MAG TPA: NF038122 family metalloprotease [Pirellulales bacterium]|nr:NF038122 family metalloprotease [Pirellulales bacterium]